MANNRGALKLQVGLNTIISKPKGANGIINYS